MRKFILLIYMALIAYNSYAQGDTTMTTSLEMELRVIDKDQTSS